MQARAQGDCPAPEGEEERDDIDDPVASRARTDRVRLSRIIDGCQE